jgi:ribosomal protein L7Ae-like RNA K-turn-binding protein
LVKVEKKCERVSIPFVTVEKQRFKKWISIKSNKKCLAVFARHFSNYQKS